MTAPSERGAETKKNKGVMQDPGFFPFLVVRSDFRFLVIPSGRYWVPLDKKEESGGRTRVFHLNNKKIMPSSVVLFLELKGSKRLNKSTLSADQT